MELRGFIGLIANAWCWAVLAEQAAGLIRVRDQEGEDMRTAQTSQMHGLPFNKNPVPKPRHILPHEGQTYRWMIQYRKTNGEPLGILQQRTMKRHWYNGKLYPKDRPENLLDYPASRSFVHKNR